VSTTHRTPGRRRSESEGTTPLTAGALLARQVVDRERGTALVAQVSGLAQEQQALSEALQEDLAALQATGQDLDALQGAPGGGMLDALVRRFRRRQEILARRSAAEGLLVRYEAVSTQLQRASAFSDELHLCALELQAEVDRLHHTMGLDARNARLAAEQLLALEQQVDALEAPHSRGADGPGTARELDASRFRLRTTALALELSEAAVQLGHQQLAPARELRDMVQGLHEEMAAFVLAASATANAAGHRIQALGMAADAPLVVTELQESLAELSHAMESTEAYVIEARRLMDTVLPDLSARLAAQSETHDVAARLSHDDGAQLSRQDARLLAEKALRDAAMAEVESWLTE
jgi:hypothetical protein